MSGPLTLSGYEHRRLLEGVSRLPHNSLVAVPLIFAGNRVVISPHQTFGELGFVAFQHRAASPAEVEIAAAMFSYGRPHSHLLLCVDL